jgi:hypothetical protein
MAELIDVLRKDEWYTIRTTRDLELDQERRRCSLGMRCVFSFFFIQGL